MMQNLSDWVSGTNTPPKSVHLLGHIARLDAALFSAESWGGDGLQVFLPKRGDDGNALKGVRLPHVRSKLQGNNHVGGPLGFYRGVECGNDGTADGYILDCQLSGDPSGYNMIGGSFIPYTSDQDNACDVFYPTDDAYLESVEDAAAYAVTERWILQEDVASIVAGAIVAATLYPGCVP
jgi:hypothetical protein